MPSSVVFLVGPACIECSLCHSTANHWGIFPEVGFTDMRQYRYYKKETRGLDFEGMIEDLKVGTRTSGFVCVLLTELVGHSESLDRTRLQCMESPMPEPPQQPHD